MDYFINIFLSLSLSNSKKNNKVHLFYFYWACYVNKNK